MSLVRFVQQLFDHGRVAVPPMRQEVDDNGASLRTMLEEYAAIYQRGLPAGLPELDFEAAEYGVRTLYHACRALVYRNIGPDELQQVIPIPEPTSDAATHWSVDLGLHFLPDVVRLARAAALDDPLVERLCELGRRWPLSSIGVARLGPVHIEPIANHPALWTLYLDRVLATRDAERLVDARVRAGLAAQLGAYPHLAGPLRAALSEDASVMSPPPS